MWMPLIHWRLKKVDFTGYLSFEDRSGCCSKHFIISNLSTPPSFSPFKHHKHQKLTHFGPTHFFSGGMHFPLYLAHCYLFFKTQLWQYLLEEVLLCSSTLMAQFRLPVMLLEHLCLPLALVSMLEVNIRLCLPHWTSCFPCINLYNPGTQLWAWCLVKAHEGSLSPNSCTTLPCWNREIAIVIRWPYLYITRYISHMSNSGCSFLIQISQ